MNSDNKGRNKSKIMQEKSKKERSKEDNKDEKTWNINSNLVEYILMNNKWKMRIKMRKIQLKRSLSLSSLETL